MTGKGKRKSGEKNCIASKMASYHSSGVEKKRKGVRNSNMTLQTPMRANEEWKRVCEMEVLWW